VSVSVCLSVRLSVGRSVCRLVRPSIRLFTSPSLPQVDSLYTLSVLQAICTNTCFKWFTATS